jgi:hypothetical protein
MAEPAEDATKTAFALAGLGGFNAHGAGFLTAARDCKVKPRLITATSGQIVVLADWLEGKDLKKALINPELEHNTVAQLQVALYGDTGVFKPAYVQALARWWRFPPFHEPALESLLDRVAPAEVYVPTRPSEDYQAIARVFNETSDMGIVFNAYNFKTGEAVLYGNAKAQDNWPQQKNIQNATPAAGIRKGSAHAELALQPITAKAVQSALWLSLYGFDNLPQPALIDGAYLRACIVSELHTFDRIFVARPLSEGWPGHGPRNWFEVQDWQTEMWFSAGYKAEVDTLLQINGLIDAGHLQGSPFKKVDLVEIAPTRPAGFFNYFIERERVFKAAYTQAKEKFVQYGLCANDKPDASPRL